MAVTTNSITFDEASDLVTGDTRACIGIVVDGRPHVVPAVAYFDRGRFVVSTSTGIDLEGIDEIVLVADEGYWFFDLRAVYVRGRIVAATIESHDDAVRFEVEPALISCWDYGRLRIDDAA